MDFNAITEVNLDGINWGEFDVIFMASGFEARSIHVLNLVPADCLDKCVVLGFPDGLNLLSRTENDAAYAGKGLLPFTSSDPLDYEDRLKECLLAASHLVDGRPLRVFVDYSVMTRAWYAYILTWIKYSGEVNSVDVVFAYAHGIYDGMFRDLQILEANSMAGFEGISAGSRRTVVLYGLGYDKFATLAVHEMMQPDRFFCLIASDGDDDQPAKHVLKENSHIIELSGVPPVVVSLSNLDQVVSKINAIIATVAVGDEVVAVPMGPKTHVLGTLLAGHKNSRLTCMHPRGTRDIPVQVNAQGRVSCWKIAYNQN